MPRKPHRSPLDTGIKPSGLSADVEKVNASFRAMVKRIACPHCAEPFTDGAVDWGDAWTEGRFDLLRESGTSECDGPVKVKCEWCDEKSWINYFAETATKALSS